MNTYLVYRVSFYVMLILATTILSVDSTDSRLDWFMPMAVVAACILAFVTVDQNPRWGLPRGLANILAVGTLGLLYLEYKSDDSQMIRCLGHWVTYLLMIKCFLPKTAEDDWFLFLLGLTQVLIGSVINSGDTVGAWLLIWSMVAVWVLGLFFLQRESRRFNPDVIVDSLSGEPKGKDPYQGLFDMPYVVATLRVLALTLTLGCFFFLMLPRQAGATRSRTSNTMAKHLTGFDEEVQLGQLGEILENDSVVMSVEFTDEARKPIHPVGEPLWRGVSLTQYEKGRWRRPQQRSLQTIVSLRPYRDTGPTRRKAIRQIIKLEPNDAATLFAIRPILELSAGQRLAPFLNPIDGSIFRPEPRGGYDYEVLSDSNPDATQESEAPPSPGRLDSYLKIPEELKDRFRQIAAPVVAKSPAGEPDAVRARAHTLESYLRDSGEFGYTLEMDVVDLNLDPVEDFLVNRKRGHCEYFASALALLLRSIDIPSRVINGFKGGDWNDLTQSMNVRQKHAHSWVEAYVGNDSRGNPIWVTLDPTPGADRDVSVASVGGMASRVRPVTDIIRYIWVFYILGYDSNRQNKLLYTPIRYTVQEVRRGYSLLWRWTKQGFSQLFSFQSLASFISIKGFFVSFFVLTLVALAARLLLAVVKRLIGWGRGAKEDAAGLSAGILFYRRLAQLLSQFDLHRSPGETQGEFAQRAARFLSGRGIETDLVAEVPPKVVEAFYRVRFGDRELTPENLDELEQSLQSLATRLEQP